MNWDIVAALAEIIAATAVVVSLIYVGLQIRDNTRVTKAESRRVHSDLAMQYMASIGQSNESVSIFRRGQSDPGSLSEDELLRYVFQVAMIAAQVESAYSDLLLGIIDKKAFDYRSANFLQMLRTPGGKVFMKAAAESLMPEFRTFLVEELDSGD